MCVGAVNTRIPAGVPGPLTLAVLDTAEAPVDVGVVTVTVRRADGTTASTGPASGAGTAARTYTLPAQSQLTTLTASWVSTVGTWTTRHDIVGGRYFTLAEARASHDELAAGAGWSDADILAKRDSVEVEVEQLTGLRFCRAGGRIVVDGGGRTVLTVPVRYVRRIAAVSLSTPGGATLALTDAQLAAIALDDVDPPRGADGLLHRVDRALWPVGRRNVTIDLEYGYDAPPPDLKDAALRLLYWRLHQRNTEILDRVDRFDASGGIYRFGTSPDQWRTGLHETVDAIIARYSRVSSDGNAGPAYGEVRMSVMANNSILHRW